MQYKHNVKQISNIMKVKCFNTNILNIKLGQCYQG